MVEGVISWYKQSHNYQGGDWKITNHKWPPVWERVLNSKSVSPAQGSGIRRKSSQGICNWRPLGHVYQRSTGLREIETPLLEGIHRIPHELGPRVELGLHKNLGQTYPNVLEDILGKQGLPWLVWGQNIVGRGPGNIHQCEIPCHFGRILYHPKGLRSPRPNNKQGGDTAPSINKQTA